MAYTVKKRCVRCHKVLRSDDTCQNEDCVLYVKETTTESANTEQKLNK